MAGQRDEGHTKETLLLLVNAGRAALSGERELAETLYDEAELEANKIRVPGERRVPPAAPDEPAVPPGFQEQGANT